MASKKLKIGVGVAGGVTTIVGLFMLLATLYNFTITGTDDFCLGIPEDPCISYINVSNPTPYNVDVYNQKGINLQFSPSIPEYYLFKKDAKCRGGKTCAAPNGVSLPGWKFIDFSANKSSYIYRFKRYSTSEFLLWGLKNNPQEQIKWTLTTDKGQLDPYWYSSGQGNKSLEKIGNDIVFTNDGKVTTLRLFNATSQLSTFDLTILNNATNEIAYAFNIPDSVDKSYIRLEVTSTETLFPYEQTGVQYVSYITEERFDLLQSKSQVTHYDTLDFSDLIQKNPLAQYDSSFNGTVFTFELWNATDFDPTIVDTYSVTVGGNYSNTTFNTRFSGIALFGDASFQYKFDEYSINDSSMALRDLDLPTPINVSNSSNCGIPNTQCLYFDGVNDKLTVGSVIPFQNLNATIMFRIVPEKSITTEQSGFDIGGGHRSVNFNATDQVTVSYLNSTDSPKILNSGATTLTTGQSNHVGVTFNLTGDLSADGTVVVKIYIDGVLKATSNFTQGHSTNYGSSTNLMFSGFNGTVQDVVILNETLSANEINGFNRTGVLHSYLIRDMVFYASMDKNFTNEVSNVENLSNSVQNNNIFPYNDTNAKLRNAAQLNGSMCAIINSKHFSFNTTADRTIGVWATIVDPSVGNPNIITEGFARGYAWRVRNGDGHSSAMAILIDDGAGGTCQTLFTPNNMVKANTTFFTVVTWKIINSTHQNLTHYFNDSYSNSTICNITQTTDLGTRYVGSDNNCLNNWKGTLDELFSSDVAFNQTMVSAIYNQHNGMNPNYRVLSTWGLNNYSAIQEDSYANNSFYMSPILVNTTARSGGSLYFNANGSASVTLSSASTLPPLNNNFSTCYASKVDNFVNTNQHVIELGFDGVSAGVNILHHSSGNVSFEINDTDTIVNVSFCPTYTDTNWHTTCLNFFRNVSTNTMIIDCWTDGVFSGNRNVSNMDKNFTGTGFYLGNGGSDTSLNPHHYLDEVFYIPNRTLSDDEIAAYNTSFGLKRVRSQGSFIRDGLDGNGTAEWVSLALTCDMVDHRSVRYADCFDNVTVSARTSTDNATWGNWSGTTRSGSTYTFNRKPEQRYLQYNLSYFSFNDTTPVVTEVSLVHTGCGCPDVATNWQINLTQACVLNNLCNITPFRVSFIETGNWTINNTIYTKYIDELITDQQILIKPIGRIMIG